MSGDDSDPPQRTTKAFDLVELARSARPAEITSATFSYVDAMLTGRMSDAELGRITDEILGDAPSQDDADSEPIRARIDAGDHAAALELAERCLARDPAHAYAKEAAHECRERLADRYLSKLGPSRSVLELLIDGDALGALGIDRWAAYVISRIDGRATIDDLTDLTGWSRLDTLRVLYELCERRIVRVGPVAPPSSRDERPVALARVRLKSSRRTE